MTYILCLSRSLACFQSSLGYHTWGWKKRHINTGCWIHLLCTPFLITSSLEHIKMGSAHPCESEMYVCSLCNHTFSTQGSLKRHWETILRQSGSFSCQVCSKHFYRKDHLGRHMKMHQLAVLLGDSAACPTDVTTDLPLPPPSPPPKRHGETPVCNLCTKTFTSQKTLMRLWQTVRRQSGGFSCQVCHRCF